MVGDYMKWIKRLLICFIGCLFFGLFGILSINFYVIGSTKNQILTLEEIKNIKDIETILVLGCQVRPNKTPSAMLEDRLKVGISLYEQNAAPTMIMSGDHRRDDYNEVKVMKDYAVKNNVPSSFIFLDHAGISTYDSIFRAKEVFQVKKIIIVSQKYHLYRALYIANQLGLEAYGVSADEVTYGGQFYREIREVLARNKDFVLSNLKIPSNISSNTISIHEDGDFTN